MSRRPSWPASRSWREPHWSAVSRVRSPCSSVRPPAGRWRWTPRSRAGAPRGRRARWRGARAWRGAARAGSGDPLEGWRLDTTGWVELPNSCFAYSEAGRSLFGTRPVVAQMNPDLYRPRPGQGKVWERRKVARLERVDGRLRLFHSMHDNVHGFEITYEIDLATGTVVRAEHITPRLPYMGICSEPQRRITSLLDEIVDGGLRKRIQATLGGEGGCGQLYDLTSHLLTLLA